MHAVSLRPAAVALLLLVTSSAQARWIPNESASRLLLNLFDRHDANPLTPRDSVCPTNANLTQCGGGLPSDICCDLNTSVCMPFDNHNGVICCPKGSQCDAMVPLTGGCSSALYNATQFPTSPIHLVTMPSTFETCGDVAGQCCPPSYFCQNGHCAAQKNNSAPTAAPSAAPSTPVTLSSAHPSAPTSTPTGSPASGAGSGGADAGATPTAADPGSAYPITAVLVGLFPGLAAGALLTMAVIVCIGRRRRRHHRTGVRATDSASDLGSIRAHVSDPIYVDDSGRTDFLRYPHHSQQQTSAAPSPALSRVRSLFSGSRRATGNSARSPRGLGVAGVTDPHTPRTPKREPSTESITIFSPPDMRTTSTPAMAAVANNRNTTYSDVMRAAGAYAPEPLPPAYQGSPGLVDPRSRGVDNGRLR